MTALNATGLFDGSPARLSRFTIASRPGVFWAAMWSVLAITEFVALMPVLFSWEPQPAWMVVYRAVGGSFAACGLVAWRRRPTAASACS